MPALPTLTITDEQAERCIAAYGSVAAYKTWLREQVSEHVLAVERTAAERSLRAQLLAVQAIADNATDPLAGAT